MIVAGPGIILCVWGIWGAYASGLSRLNAKYALVSRGVEPADRAVRLTDSDAEAHSSRALVLRNQRDWEGAVREFERAATLRPRDYVLWYELALARDNADDAVGAISACEQAVRLAPTYARPHWLLGNLLFRAGRRDEAFTELQRAANGNAEFLPNLIDLAWGAYGGDAQAVQSLVRPQTNASRIALAQYFAGKGKFDEAIALFRAAGGLSADERRKLLRVLLAARRFKEAYEVWSLGQPPGDVQSPTGMNAITNPSFEGTIKLSELGFGWQQPGSLENISISLDAGNPRNGNRSLRIEFNGNSNPASAVVSQTVLVEPGTNYELKFAARTEQLITGGLPQITVSEATAAGEAKPVASLTLPAEAGSWRDYSLSFRTGETQAVVINLNRQYCSSSPCPAFGRVWLDDFSLDKRGRQ
jgi:hypothetical protein